MSQEKAIGGYFELELHKGEEYHKDALALNTARNCLEYILLARQYTKVYIPRFTCEVVLEPFTKHNILYEFYSINEQLEPVFFPELKQSEAFLYTNYFGLKQNGVKKVVEYYGKQAIIDNAQAFYAPPLPGIDTFYSPRKFFGVPDGGYLYTDAPLLPGLPQDTSWHRMQHLLRRIDEGAEAGYADFRTNSEVLKNAPIKKMSMMTHALLQSIDYNFAKQQRFNNYSLLSEELHSSNGMRLPLSKDDIPLVYPYLANNNSLKSKLINNKIFIATYWPNVLKWAKEASVEFKLASQILALPIDQRYRISDMEKIIHNLNH